MEEKNNKLTYEQLEAYAQQTTEQAKRVFKENQMLKQTLNKMSIENSFREVECALKCLDHADMFSVEFIEDIVSRLEEVLSPSKEDSNKEEEDKE